jgi:diguanylate cyclase (GGDEF)-like protein
MATRRSNSAGDKLELTPERVKILVAEDDPVSSQMLLGHLKKWDYDVQAVDNGVDALAVLRNPASEIQLAILDWVMPGMDGPAVCRELRRKVPATYIYVILLTGKDLKEEVVEGLDAGADDYLSKPYYAQELLSRIRAAERIIRLQGALELANDRLHRLATTDSLTQLFNRHAIMDRLSDELSRSLRRQLPLGAALLDIDYFKRVNDTLGHAAGDAVLQNLARLLVGNLREYDQVGRYGGEEFLLVIPDITRAELGGLLERMCATIARVPFDTGAGMQTVTASFGACWVPPGTHCALAELLAQADRLLYEAKAAGRNRVEIGDYEEEPGTIAEH